MDQVKFFLLNYYGYISGEIVHEDISSIIIKKYMYTLNLWRIPLRGQSLWRFLVGPICYLYCYYVLAMGFPLSMADIPNLGKYINITAGISMSFGKWIFVHWKRDELSLLIETMNKRSQELRLRGFKDLTIQRLRNTYFVEEMSIFMMVVFGNLAFVVGIYGQLLSVRPLELIVPFTSPVTIPGISDNYAVNFTIQFFLVMFISSGQTCVTVMIGNVYSQILLHLDVLHYDCLSLDRAEALSPEQYVEGFRDLARKYQSVVELHNKCNSCMRELLLNDVSASMIAVIFSCVEFGIVVNEDLKACFRPALYFLFLYSLFFYWCWLGSRLTEKSSRLALAAYMYKEDATTVKAQKIQLQFIHMVQKPLAIKAKPYFVLDYGIFVNVLRLCYQFTTVFKKFSANYYN